MIFLILAGLSYGLADDPIDNELPIIGLAPENDLKLRSLEDDLIDESEADAAVEDLTDEDVSTLEKLGEDSIDGDIELDETFDSPIESLLGDKFTGDDVQTIEPVSEESEDEGIHFHPNFCN